MNENRNNSYLFSSKDSSAVLRTCTSCCPFDDKNLFHPQFNYQTDIIENGLIKNTDACCLNKLQVDCRIQCRKKKKKHKKMMKNKRSNSIYSSQSTKRSISSSSQLSPNRKRKKFDSSTNINSHYIHNYEYDSQTSSSSLSTTESEITEQSFASHKSANAQQENIHENIQNLKSSIDNLTQLIIHQQKPLLSNQLISNPSISFLDKFRRFFFSSKSIDDQINKDCCQILQRNNLTKQNLLSIYNLFDKNEKIFLNWLRTIMPEYFLPLLLNYVKHFDSISTDNE